MCIYSTRQHQARWSPLEQFHLYSYTMITAHKQVIFVTQCTLKLFIKSFILCRYSFALIVE